MFYSQLILAKKGPLGQVWLAAHWDKKLTKATITAADVGQAADSIANPVVPLALRVSGHLLLGVTRIYSRKVNYLFSDCSEALVKIKMAFRPGVVDLPEQQVTANPSSINVSSFGEFDAHIPYDIHALVAPSLTEWMTTPSQTQARRQDITLADITDRTQDDSFGGTDSFEDSFGGGDWQAFDIDSNQELDSSTISDIERARDGDPSGLVVAQDTSMLLDNSNTDVNKPQPDDDVDMFQTDKDDLDMNADVPDIEMGMNPDDSNADHGMEMPPTPPRPEEASSQNLSIDFAIDEDGNSLEPQAPSQKKLRKRKIGRDSMTELSSAFIKKGLKDVSDIVRVRGHVSQKRQKVADSSPWTRLSAPSTVSLSSALLDMFKVTMNQHKLPASLQAAAEKRQDGDDAPVERMRRQSHMGAGSYAEQDEDDLVPHAAEKVDQNNADEFEFGGGQELEALDHGIEMRDDDEQKEEEREVDEDAVHLGLDLDLTLAPVNDIQANLGTLEESAAATTTAVDHKWHPHTVKVLRVLRQALEDKETVSYKALAKTTRSRRTAAALFFEMLQLKTLDFIDVDQPKPYGNIHISKTTRFMESVPAVDGM
ncbi:hypothetical protein H310_06959 [Aphanomyces invadans]|uniref:Rad21/Rec8-like protein N-terminal domain-containing protein n=1 Tax=Aphanomyces invadans TaxID=157072 RepID=A0A024U5C5_9STRA|nr:hypothetical protein H310_06959 [Aphanomyces invadans]ETW01444.1 hypothetical protein H310_06959 [Aphanomyces invadans]|eukprot:XP_008870442.1 hypothetical protein H310_06959 [Aphanomyces invadans]